MSIVYGAIAFFGVLLLAGVFFLLPVFWGKRQG
jgi:hypothetical protein